MSEIVALHRSKRFLINGLKNVFLVIMGAFMLLASWILLQNTVKEQLLRTIDMAVSRNNIYVFAQNTDWQNLRDALKTDLKERARDNPGLPQESEMLEQVVEYYVRPESIPVLLHHYHDKAAHMRPRDFVRRIYFSGLTEITMDIASPPQLDRPWLQYQKPARAVLHLVGTKWVLKRLDAPDYLIPTRVPVAVK